MINPQLLLPQGAEDEALGVAGGREDEASSPRGEETAALFSSSLHWLCGHQSCSHCWKGEGHNCRKGHSCWKRQGYRHSD